MECDQCGQDGGVSREYVYYGGYLSDPTCLCDVCHTHHYVSTLPADYYGDSARPAAPSQHKIGSQERMDVMRARAALGQCLWHEDDSLDRSLYQSRPTVRRVQERYQAHFDRCKSRRNTTVKDIIYIHDDDAWEFEGASRGMD
jgi:hypothetical protein